MPTLMSAKTIAENALSIIGAFPASQSQPDPGELRKTLRWMEMVLNNEAGIRPIPSFTKKFEIELEAGVGDYNLLDYVDAAGAQQVFSVVRVDDLGNVTPVVLMYDSQDMTENLTETGYPERATVTRGNDPVLRIFPMPTQTVEDNGEVLRVRIQTFHEAIDETGVADSQINLSPAWNLWLSKRTAYEIGLGPVRRLAEGELKRLDEDCMRLESALLARDGLSQSGKPPVTEPMAGSF